MQPHSASDNSEDETPTTNQPLQDGDVLFDIPFDNWSPDDKLGPCTFCVVFDPFLLGPQLVFCGMAPIYLFTGQQYPCVCGSRNKTCCLIAF